MIEISNLEDIAALKESTDVECKLAQGRDGKGACPKSLWETYSAFANTQGGDIFLGLEEDKYGKFSLAGIQNTDKVIDEIWSNLNDRTLVSANVLFDGAVRCIQLGEKSIVHVHVPRAPREARPVFIKGNPIGGTYKRFNSTDIRAPEEVVKRMLAEQVENSRDNVVLRGFGLEDLDAETIRDYRQRYANLHPDHPWNELDIIEFLRSIGAWRRDRETGVAGPTRAGLLMFGKLPSIKEGFPNYMLDYQERPEARRDAGWVDRLTLDGAWAGNLFEFYQRVIRKLTADLKVPFEVHGDQRQDETFVHRALREALVNALVHADYSGRASILVVKRPDMFGFRNPGDMRIPVELALKGGESDCRNRLIQDMFRYIGLGESAGSGLPKIFDGWRRQHWRTPLLREQEQPSAQTLLELHTLSLVPEEAIQELREQLGDEVFDALDDRERLILVTAHIEKTVDHSRMMSVIDIHPRDLSAIFARLVEKQLLFQEGSGRGTVYFLEEARLDDAYEAFHSSGGLKASSGGLTESSGGLEQSSGGLDALKSIAKPVSSTKKAAKSVVEKVILALCTEQPCTLEQLTELLQRSEGVVRKDYLQPMIKDKRLRYQYPTMPNHPSQAYITNREGEA